MQNFSGDEYLVSFQTWNLTWTRGLGDANSKEFRDKKEEFKDELSEKIISQAFMNPSSEIVSFKVTGFKKGSGNVVVVLGSLILKQSHYNNSELINNKLKSALTKYFYEGPKTL